MWLLHLPTFQSKSLFYMKQIEGAMVVNDITHTHTHTHTHSAVISYTHHHLLS